MAKREKKRSVVQRAVNRVIFYASLAVFLLAVIQLLRIGFDYGSADQEYRELQKYIDPTEQTGTAGRQTKKADREKEEFAVDFAALKRENPDCIGWIRFPHLEISYPIMQGEDNDEYLRKTFTGEIRTAGSIFMDAANAADFSDAHTFVYGHSMKNGSMFGLLRGYEEEAFYRENPGFYIYTPKGGSYYEIYSCYLAEVGEEESFRLTFSSGEEYQDYQTMVKERSLYDTGVRAEPGRNTVTLMTCNKAGDAYRLLVHAVQMGGNQDGT